MNAKERIFALKISSIMAIRMLGLFMIFPIFSVYGQNYPSATPLLIGIAIGIYGLTQALLQIPFGYLSDIYGRKPLLIIGLVLFFIGSVICALSSDIIGVIIGRSLQGAGAISAVLMAFLSDYITPSQRIKANGFVGIQIGFAFTLSLLIGPIIAVNLGLSGLFWIISSLSVMALLVVATLPNIKAKTQYKLSITHIKKVLNLNLLRLDFGVFTLHLILTCVFIAIPLLLLEYNIVNIEDNWQIYLPVILVSFVIMLPIVILAEKFKKIKLALIAGITILFLSQVLFYQTRLTYSSFFVFLTLFFIAFNALEALLPSLVAKISSDEKRGLAMGLFSTSQFLGAFTGGLLGGWIYDKFGLNSVFLLTIFITIAWWLIILKMPQN